MPFDYGLHSRDYGRHRHGPPDTFFGRLESFVELGEARVLDLATGPGTVGLQLARRGARVTGIDMAEAQIGVARERAAERGLAGRANFAVARAEATGAEAGSFDLVICGQAWHWLDPPAVMAEVRRVLRPGGTLAIVGYSYLAHHSPVAADSEALILRFNPDWAMAGWSGLFPRWVEDVIEGGLEFVEQFCWDYDEPYSHEDWRGRIRTCNGVGSGGLPPEAVARFDEALAAMLAERYPDPMPVRHRLWCVIGRRAG